MRIVSQVGQLMSSSGSGLPGPQAIWAGYKDSSSALVMAWPPLVQTVVNFTAVMNVGASTGVLASPINPGTYAFTWTGTPGSFGPEYHNVTVAADGVTVTLTTNGNIAHTQNSGPGGVAQIQYDAVDSYNYYRSTDQINWTKANSVPVFNSPNVSLSSLLQPWYAEPTGTLLPATQYFYRATAVLNGNESAPSPIVSITTRSAAVGAQPPATPTDPASWIQSNTPPAATPVVCTTQAQFAAALAGLNLSGPNVIKLQSNTTFAATALPGWNLPALTASGSLWIASDQVPEINAAGTLIPYRSDFPTPIDVSFNLIAAPALNATSATLTAAWTGKDGAYWTIFTETATGYEEQRLVLYANGSAAISWPANLNGSPPLTAACNATIKVGILAGVTPCPKDLAAMATLQMGAATNSVGVSVPAAANNIRFVGIRIIPTPGAAQASEMVSFPFNGFGATPVINPNHIYFDRCIFGLSTADPNYTYIVHGIALNCDHFFCNQSYIQGVVTFFASGATSPSAGDSNGFFCLGGGPQCWQNTYFEAQAEGGIYGGAAVYPQSNIPHDIVMRGCFNIKPLMWQSMFPSSNGVAGNSRGIGADIKNHQELKTGIRAEYYNNVFWNTWPSKQAGQFGAFNCGPLEQASTGQFPITMACPWSQTTDINFHDNYVVNVQRLGQIHAGDVCATGIAERIIVENSLIYINPLYGDSFVDKFNFWGITCNSIIDFKVDRCTFVFNQTNTLDASPAGVTSLYNTSANIAFVPTYTPNVKPAWCDGATITNNILGGNQALLVQSKQGAAAWPFFANTSTSIMTNNLIAIDTQAYPAGNFASPPIPYANIGFTNWNPNSVAQPWGATRPAAGDWNVTSGTYATASTTAGPIGAIFGITTPPAITTTTIPNATVGSAYLAALAATGGTGSLSWNIESVTPNKHLWLHCSADGRLFGIAQCDNTGQGGVDTVVVRVTDSIGNSATASYFLTTAVSGAIAVASPAVLQPGAVGSGWTHQLLASGGAPPYIFWKITAHTGVNAYWITNNGWLSIVGGAVATTVGTPDTVTVSVTDVGGNTATATLSITVNATIQLAGVDYVLTYPGSSQVGILRFPPARKGHKYRHVLNAANGGTGAGQVFAVSSGALPAGLSLTAGVISGTPSNSGSSAFSLTCTDSGSNVTSAIPCYLNVGATNKGTRPVANTAAGFFVDTTGKLCDPGGFRFPYIGINRENSGSNAGSAWSTSGTNMVRFTLFTTNFRGVNTGTAMGGAGGYAAQAFSHTSLNEYVVMSNFWRPGTTGAANNLTGTSASVDIGLVAAWWCDNVAAWNASGLQNRAGINPQNEWGPTTQAIQFVYAAPWDGPVGTGTTWQMPIASVNSGTGVITLSSTAATHPLANAAQIGWVYLSGGTINAAVQISTTVGGSSGAWTITATTPSVLAGYTSGGTISGGVVGMLRAAGYTDPLHIDIGAAFGQRIDTTTAYGPAVAQSDPLQNVVLAYHAYNQTVNYAARISGVTTGGSAVISYRDSATTHPMSPTGLFANINAMFVTGVNGMTGANGTLGCTGQGLGGVAGAWTTTTTATTTGTYTTGGYAIPGVISGTFGYHHIDRLVVSLASLQASGVAVSIEEYGNTNTSGASAGATPMCFQEVIQAVLAAQQPSTYWSMEDPTGLGVANGNPGQYTYGCTNNSEVYTTPSQLLASGIDVILNPRYGIHANSAPAPVYLP